LWWVSDEQKLPPRVLGRLQREDSEIMLSVSSAWEIAIKAKLGRLELPAPPLSFLHEASELYRVTMVPIELEDAVRAGELPLHHKDPFDRLLVAQAQLRGVAIVTPDEAFGLYRVKIVW
jgi:PIN domain nuclease of toxin-antitoxin system